LLTIRANAINTWDEILIILAQIDLRSLTHFGHYQRDPMGPRWTAQCELMLTGVDHHRLIENGTAHQDPIELDSKHGDRSVVTEQQKTRNSDLEIASRTLHFTDFD
jgi:hypothetical protein